MPAITMTSERTGHCTKMGRPFVPFNGSATSRHKRSSVGFITATLGFRFSVHTAGLSFHSTDRQHHVTSDPRWASSPLRSDLGFRYTHLAKNPGLAISSSTAEQACALNYDARTFTKINSA